MVSALHTAISLSPHKASFNIRLLGAVVCPWCSHDSTSILSLLSLSHTPRTPFALRWPLRRVYYCSDVQSYVLLQLGELSLRSVA